MYDCPSVNLNHDGDDDDDECKSRSSLTDAICSLARDDLFTTTIGLFKSCEIRVQYTMFVERQELESHEDFQGDKNHCSPKLSFSNQLLNSCLNIMVVQI